MRKDRLTACLAIALGVTGLVFTQGAVDRAQQAARLNRAVSDPDIPASLAVTTLALGPLRGLIVDVLWWRAMQQQQEGAYFDALQLADWITRLQPSFASVWAFHGWNMAYNIASDFGRKEDRWQWILHAIELLRDEGLKYNPDDRVIRHELGRIFFDRIGGVNDPASEYYKTQWAFKMMTYFHDGTARELQALAQAAASEEELRQRPGVADYLAGARALNADLLDFAAHPPERPPILVDGMSPDDCRRAAGEIRLYSRRHRIESQLKLSIPRMLFIDHEYGPLDWRLHQAHAIYWTAETRFKDFITQNVNYAQLVRQAMMSSFQEGRLFYNPRRNVMTRTANLAIIGRLHNYIEYVMQHAPHPAVMKAHEHFVARAVSVLYSFNHVEAARELYEHLVTMRPDLARTSFEQYLRDSLRATLDVPDRGSARAVVESALYQSFDWLYLGEPDRSNGAYKLAVLLWREHQTKYAREPAKLLPPLSQLAVAVKARYLAESKIDAEAFDGALRYTREKHADAVDIGDFGHGEHDE